MERRQFLASAVAASAGMLSSTSGAQPLSGKTREYYELRKYSMQSGPQTKLTDKYMAEVLIPALNRLGMSTIGAFNLTLGPETPSLYLLIPSGSLDALVGAEQKLGQDEAFLKAAEAFWNAPAAAAPFVRVESSLLIAFEGWPRLTVPPETTKHAKRVFQLRTYESPTNRDHVRKVEMFNSGEYEIFQRAGFHPVFFGDTLVGPRLPNLTYMLSFPEVAEMDGMWQRFMGDPDWKKLSSSPQFAFEPIVSNVTNLILAPTSYSQV